VNEHVQKGCKCVECCMVREARKLSKANAQAEDAGGKANK